MVIKMELHELPTDRNWTRRLITTPTWYFLGILLPLSLPVVIPVMAFYDLVTRNRLSTSRTMLFFTYFFVLESIGLTVAFWMWIRRVCGMSEKDYQMANRKLQRWWARGNFWGTGRIFSMDIDIQGLEALEDPTPAVVLSRHASTLDTMLPIAVVRELKEYRFVIKSELLVDPTLDYCAQRFPNVFVNRGSDDPDYEVDKVLALGKDLDENEAVVVYPEGTRFLPEKRERLLEKFEDDPEMLTVTESLKNTLPPLREGGIKLLESTPEADVVFIAHRGIDGAGAMSDLIKGRLTEAFLEISIWRIPADEVPRDADKIREFMVENWQRIDRFIGEKADVRQREEATVE